MKRDIWKTKWALADQQPLGKGGQGLTHRVHRLDDDGKKLYVLKELLSPKDPERRSRMIGEVRNLRALNHPQIPKFVDSNADQAAEDEELYLVMEYVPGPNLHEFYAQTPPDLNTTVTIVSSLLQTLSYCHETTVHRDIKPTNIILRDSDPALPVLVDFGLSFNAEQKLSNFDTPSQQHLGNRFILLPEHGVRDAHKREKVSDVTQCAGILFYLLTGLTPDNITDGDGRPPHKRPASVEKLHGYPEPLHPQLQRLFDVGFALPYIGRWQTAASLQREVLKLAAAPEAPPSLDEILEQYRNELLQLPEHVVRDRLRDAVTFAQNEADKIFRTFYAKFVDIALPQNARTIKLPHIQPLWSIQHLFHTRYHGATYIRCTLVIVRDDNELVVSGCCDRAAPQNVNERGSIQPLELARLGIFDPELQTILQRAFEQFIRRQVLPQLKLQ